MSRTIRIRRRRIAALTCGLLAVGILGTLSIESATVDGVAPGTRVAGVDLGTSPERARAQILADWKQRAATSVPLTLDGRTVASFRPATLGARPLVDDALSRAARARPGTLGRTWRRVTGGSATEVGLSVAYSDEAIDTYISDLAATIDRPPVDAGFVARGATVVTRTASEGLTVQQGVLRARLAKVGSNSSPIDVPVARQRPTVSDDVAVAAATRARSILGQRVTVRVGRLSRNLPTATVARALRLREGTVALDALALAPALSRAFKTLERAPVSARFITDGQRATVAPSQAGRVIDAESVSRGIMSNAQPIVATVKATEAPFTTRQARALRIGKRVGGYTTSFRPGQQRVVNVALGARVLDGYILKAGETLSLNEVLQQRTEARGFVPAPMIVGTIEVPAVGGGVSQVATTLYNAALESGLEIVRHTPHRLFISRYPAGRDATISWTEPDLVIRNDWENPILIRAQTGESWITINFYSQPLGRRVEITTSEPYAQTDPPTRKIINSELKEGQESEIQPGGKGFSVTVTRRVFRADQLVRDDRFATTYAPDPHLIAVPPGTPDAIELPKAP